MTGPTLSVVMANYNHATFLREALESMLAQSRPPDEIVIVDDGSQDGSVAIIEEFAVRAPIRLIRHERNVGAVASYREGLAAAQGTYVHLAAADDRVGPGLYERAIALLEQHPAAGLCASLTEIIDEESYGLGVLPSAVVAPDPGYLSPAETAAAVRRYGYWALTNASVYRRAALEAVGGFRPELAHLTDAFFTDAIALRFGACFIPAVLGALRITTRNLSRDLQDDFGARLRVSRAVYELMIGEFSDVFPRDYAARWYALQSFGIAFDAAAARRATVAGSGPRAPSARPLRTLLSYLAIDARLAVILARNVAVWRHARAHSRRTLDSLRRTGFTEAQLYR